MTSTWSPPQKLQPQGSAHGKHVRKAAHDRRLPRALRGARAQGTAPQLLADGTWGRSRRATKGWCHQGLVVPGSKKLVENGGRGLYGKVGQGS